MQTPGSLVLSVWSPDPCWAILEPLWMALAVSMINRSDPIDLALSRGCMSARPAAEDRSYSPGKFISVTLCDDVKRWADS